jgi:hypothetical protein
LPRGGDTGFNNNCQSSTVERIAQCCLTSTWIPQPYAAHFRGRCLVYSPGNLNFCRQWEFPDWRPNPNQPTPPPGAPMPVVPPIDDYSHAGWDKTGFPPPGVEYPPVDYWPGQTDLPWPFNQAPIFVG